MFMIILVDYGNIYIMYILDVFEGCFEMFYLSFFIIVLDKVVLCLGKNVMLVLVVNQYWFVIMIELYCFLMVLVKFLIDGVK